MKPPIKYKVIKIRESTYKELKMLAVKHDCSMLEFVERMVSAVPRLKVRA